MKNVFIQILNCIFLLLTFCKWISIEINVLITNQKKNGAFKKISIFFFWQQSQKGSSLKDFLRWGFLRFKTSVPLLGLMEEVYFNLIFANMRRNCRNIVNSWIMDVGMLRFNPKIGGKRFIKTYGSQNLIPMAIYEKISFIDLRFLVLRRSSDRLHEYAYRKNFKNIGI